MGDLREAKKKQYSQVAFRLRRWWKDVKTCSDRRIKDKELIRSVAESADVSTSMASKVLYRKRRSKRVLAYISAGIERIQRQEDIPEWLCEKPDLSDVKACV